jgi:hypothetical protein
MKQHITTLLEKPMNRREFLQHAGIGALMLFGGGLVVQAFGGLSRKSPSRAGYGGSTYGGA